jgi:hypothetical protein
VIHDHSRTSQLTANLGTRRLTPCVKQPSKQRVAGSNPAGRAHVKSQVRAYLAVAGRSSHARTLVLAERRPGVLADLIGYRPLALSGRVKVDESGPRAVVAHVFHQFAEARARVCGELVAGMAQVMIMPTSA